jgi:nucleotide-binding universal stress UspA family protein
MFGRLLVGFDGSADARAALHTAVGLASATGAEVAVVPVVPTSRGETEEDRRAAFEDEAGPLRQMAADDVRRCGEPDVRVEVEAIGGDHPGRALLAYAERGAFDLVVVGRHGRERAMHGGMGRVAQELVERSGPAVLVVSHPEEQP